MATAPRETDDSSSSGSDNGVMEVLRGREVVEKGTEDNTDNARHNHRTVKHKDGSEKNADEPIGLLDGSRGSAGNDSKSSSDHHHRKLMHHEAVAVSDQVEELRSVESISKPEKPDSKGKHYHHHHNKDEEKHKHKDKHDKEKGAHKHEHKHNHKHKDKHDKEKGAHKHEHKHTHKHKDKYDKEKGAHKHEHKHNHKHDEKDEKDIGFWSRWYFWTTKDTTKDTAEKELKELKAEKAENEHGRGLLLAETLVILLALASISTTSASYALIGKSASFVQPILDNWQTQPIGNVHIVNTSTSCPR